MVKPEFLDDEKLATISRDARLLFIGLWINSDDYGVVKGNHKWLKSKIFPYDECSSQQFTKWLTELENIDCIRPFSTSGENFYWIRTFSQHQTINKPSQTRNPTPPDTLQHYSGSPTVALPSETEVETEVETEKKLSCSSPTEKRAVMSDGFDVFWKEYPRKIGKQIAFRSWEKLKKAKVLPPIEKILQAVKQQIDSDQWQKDEGQFIPHPATWLNQGRWDDEPATVRVPRWMKLASQSSSPDS